jgi:hypothetical protein
MKFSRVGRCAERGTSRLLVAGMTCLRFCDQIGDNFGVPVG